MLTVNHNTLYSFLQIFKPTMYFDRKWSSFDISDKSTYTKLYINVKPVLRKNYYSFAFKGLGC
jgi:hypothetical protein